MAPRREYTVKCVACNKSRIRTETIKVTTIPQEFSEWVKRLDKGFEANCKKVHSPRICLSHFPRKKGLNPRLQVMPYKNGLYQCQAEYKDEDCEDEEAEQADEFLTDSENDDDFSDDSEDEPDEDILACGIGEEFKNILVCWANLVPLISICLACWGNGSKVYADVQTLRRGAAIQANMYCSRCESSWSWNSSKVCNRSGKRGPPSYIINKWLVAAISTTGNGFSVTSLACFRNNEHLQKVRDFFSTMKTPFLSKQTFHKIFNQYVEPSINLVHTKHNFLIFSRICRNIRELGPLNLAGDGQFDSRGFSAYICRFSLMDIATKFILDFQVCRKQRGGNSNALEKQAHETVFPRLLQKLQDLTNLPNPVCSLTTDRCTNLTSSMKGFPSVQHLYDAWHWIRSVRKDIGEKYKQKQFLPMKVWVRPLINHIHTAICSSGGNGPLAFQKILSFFHHCRNVHSNFEDIKSVKFDLFTQCAHAPSQSTSDQQEKYLDLSKRSHEKAHRVLLEILMKGNREKDLDSVSPHLATSALESFHSLATRYTPKEKFLDLKSYATRTKLAVLHWNELQLEELDGTRTIIRQHPYWCKTKKQIIQKKLKTKGRHLWRHEIVQLSLDEDAIQIAANTLEEVDARAEAEEVMYNIF